MLIKKISLIGKKKKRALPNMELAYAQMSKDKKREADALNWAETTFKDMAREKRLGPLG